MTSTFFSRKMASSRRHSASARRARARTVTASTWARSCAACSKCHESFLLEQPCTSQLQTFHRPRNVDPGSPVKASNLNFGQRAHTRLVYDPRPQHKRNLPHYNTHVRSLVLNCSFTPRIPISHMYAPANPYAIDVDHDYLAERQSDTFIRTLEP